MNEVRNRILTSIDGGRNDAEAANDRRVAMALGMLAAAQASISSAAALLAAAPEGPAEEDPTAECAHTHTQEAAVFGDGPPQVFCLRCGAQVEG